MKRFMQVIVASAVLLLSQSGWAAHPLISDDTGTQGAGGFQVEVNGEYGFEKESLLGVESVERVISASVGLTYGITDRIDGVLGAPYVWADTRESDWSAPTFARSNEKGLADVSLQIKWRFYESGGLSLGIKPGMTAPTGSERRGLGAGKYGYSAYLIASQLAEPWSFHANAGYARNNNRADDRENLCHLSLASEVEVAPGLKLVVNAGVDRAPDRSVRKRAAFLLGGIIYAVNKDLDLDVGIRGGLTDPATDGAVLGGVTARF